MLNELINRPVTQSGNQADDVYSPWLKKFPPHVLQVAAFDFIGWSPHQIATRHSRSTLAAMAGEISTALKNRQDSGSKLFREAVSEMALNRPAAELLWAESSLKRLFVRERPHLSAAASVLADYFEGYPPDPEADIAEWVASVADVLALAWAKAGAAEAWEDLRSRHESALRTHMESYGRTGDLLDHENARLWQLAAREMDQYDPAKWSVARWLRWLVDLLCGDMPTFEVVLAQHAPAMNHQVRGSRWLFRDVDRDDARQQARTLSWQMLAKFDPSKYSLNQYFTSRTAIAIRRTAEKAGELPPTDPVDDDDGHNEEIPTEPINEVQEDVAEEVMRVLVKIYARPRQEHARLAWGLGTFGKTPPRRVVSDFWDYPQELLAGWLEDFLHTEYSLERTKAIGIFLAIRNQLKIKQLADKSFEYFAPAAELEELVAKKQKNGTGPGKTLNQKRADTVASWVYSINREHGIGRNGPSKKS